MALGDVFQKTAGGVAELSARTVKLAPLTRMALVLIDGVKPVSELAEKLGGAAPVEAAVNELLGHHFVVQVSAAAPAPVAANDANAAAAPVTPAMSFEVLRKWAAKHVSGAMGPMGDDYCLRIERSKQQEDLDTTAEMARNAISSYTTRAKGDAFWTQYLANRGG